MFSLSELFGTKPNYSNITNMLSNPTGPNTAYQQFAGVYPNLSQSIGTAAGNIQSQMQGQLPSDVTADIKDQGAAWGLQTGMPGSGAEGNYTLEDLGLTSLQEQQQGLSNYLNFAPALQSMFTFGPSATTDILSGVDVNNAAPNPDVVGYWNDVAQGKDAGAIGSAAANLLGSLGSSGSF
jgi:hypothetical protein